MEEEKEQYEAPTFLKPYIDQLHGKEYKPEKLKCKNCENLVVTKLIKEKTTGKIRGAGECYKKSFYKWDTRNPRYCYFSDPICSNYKPRTKPLEKFRGGNKTERKISILYHKFGKERCIRCCGRPIFHDDESIFCQCKSIIHTIEEV